MRVGACVHGSPFGTPAGTHEDYRGAHTHMRSEGTWILAVALNMARHGDDVTIFNYAWGDRSQYPLPAHVTLQPQIGGEYDVFIDVGWDDIYAVDRFSRVRAKQYIHGWGGDPAGCTFLQYATAHGLKNHYMARTSRCFKKLFDNFPYSVYMPTPLVDKIKPRGNFSSRKMLWGNRGAFCKHYTPYSEKVLELMERHSEYEYTVLLYGDVKERALNEAGRPDVVQRFEKLPHKRLLEPYTGLPHDEFLRELSESKILLANGNPSAHPQTLEAVCYGSIPLIWQFAEHHFQTLSGLKVNEMFDVDGPTGMDAMLDDEARFNNYYQSLKSVTVDHEYDNAYNMLMEELRRKEDG